MTATQVHTQHVIGTQVYMAPEVHRGQISTKLDSYAFGLVIVEVLTGYPILAPIPGKLDLMALFEEDLGSPDKLAAHLDKRASWHQHEERVSVLYGLAERCLELRRNQRPEVGDLIPELEEARALPGFEDRLAKAYEIKAEADNHFRRKSLYDASHKYTAQQQQQEEISRARWSGFRDTRNSMCTKPIDPTSTICYDFQEVAC